MIVARSKVQIVDEIAKHIQAKYLGSKDIEVTDSIDFCEYFENRYGTDEGRALLKTKFLKLEKDLCVVTAWNPPSAVDVVKDANPDDIPDFCVSPWQLGFTTQHSVKGKSKLVYIMDTVDGFLKKPYDSKTEPLQVLFGPRSTVGTAVEDWSMVLSIGMGKASACRMILEAVCELNMDTESIKEIGSLLKALFRMRCTYDPADTEEEQIDRAFAAKCRLTERPRPDPIMMAKKWMAAIIKQGLTFASVIDDKIKKYNVDKNEGFGVMEHEIQFIKAYPHQESEYIDILEKHWQNFKVLESAVPPKRLAFGDLSPDTKVKRCEKENTLFNKIYSWTPLANVLWLMREIGIFCRAIKDAQRLNRKINLRTNAKAFRNKTHELSHDEICVFVYFIPEFKKHTTEAQFDDLMNRLCKGYLDKELHEKAKTMDAKLSVWDFRFLVMVTGKEAPKVSGPRSLEVQAEEVEVALFKEKLDGEVKLWNEYKRGKAAWEASTRQAKRQDNNAQGIRIIEKANSVCTDYTPVSKLCQDGVQAWIMECISNWTEKESLSKDNIYTIFIVRLDVLGQKYHINLYPTLRLISDYISHEPMRSAAIVIAPNSGKDDAYNEQAIEEAIEEVDGALRDDQYRLRVRRGTFQLDETSLGSRSTRPGFTTAWMCTSDATNVDLTNPRKWSWASHFEKSFIFKRRRTMEDLKVLADTDFVNPCAALVRSSKGAEGLSKAQRSKQWHTGIQFFDGLRSSVLHGLGLRITDGVAWIDTTPYDDKFQQSVIQAQSHKSPGVPRQMILSPIWVNMGVHGPDQVEAVDNHRISVFIKKSVRNFLASKIRDKSITFDDVPIVDPAAVPVAAAPTLLMDKFLQTCPNAAGFLPLRQDILSLLEQKVRSEIPKEGLNKIIQEHDKVHNPSGVPFKGEAKRSAPQDPTVEEGQHAKTCAPESDGPRSKEEFKEDEIFPGQSSDHEFMIKDGKLWTYAHEDCIISNRKPICKFWGEYICGSDRKKDIAKHKAENYMWCVDNMDFLGVFACQKGKAETNIFNNHSPSKLSDFMRHLEDQGKAKFNIECHELQEITQQGQDVSEVTYKVKVSENCLFLPKALPAKSKPSKANAGSAMNFSQWNFKERQHNLGRVKMMMAMNFDEEANSIIPVKPMVYLTESIKMKKGQFILLG